MHNEPECPGRRSASVRNPCSQAPGNPAGSAPGWGGELIRGASNNTSTCEIVGDACLQRGWLWSRKKPRRQFHFPCSWALADKTDQQEKRASAWVIISINTDDGVLALLNLASRTFLVFLLPLATPPSPLSACSSSRTLPFNGLKLWLKPRFPHVPSRVRTTVCAVYLRCGPSASCSGLGGMQRAPIPGLAFGVRRGEPQTRDEMEREARVLIPEGSCCTLFH